jgi:CheY-like chemotaxis protein
MADSEKETPDSDLGHLMPLTSQRQRSRPGAIIVLSADEVRDPDILPPEGLDGDSGGYQAPMTQEQDRPGQESETESRDGPRILLVDDAAAIRNALRGVLEDAGMEVVGEAPDGTQGVALAASLRPDVVLMDLRMPSSNGFEATAKIVDQFPDVRVVVLSAYESEESAEAVRAAGAFAFLPKSCGADQIRETVVAAWRSS